MTYPTCLQRRQHACYGEAVVRRALDQGAGFFDVRREVAVFVVEADLLAQQRLGFFQRCRCLVWRAEVYALAGGQQFYCQNTGGVVGHVAQAAAGEGGHRHVVFLVGASGQAVYRCRVRQRFVFARQCRAGDLGDHEAGVNAAVIDEERWQLGQMAVDQQRHAAFGQRAKLELW